MHGANSVLVLGSQYFEAEEQQERKPPTAPRLRHKIGDGKVKFIIEENRITFPGSKTVKPFPLNSRGSELPAAIERRPHRGLERINVERLKSDEEVFFVYSGAYQERKPCARKAGHMAFKGAFFDGWDTRIRTRKNRTKTCCVTITPYPNPEAFIAKSGAKVRILNG